MFKSTKTHWQWTAAAEAKWTQHDKEPRRAGQALMERNAAGYYVRRTTVPLSWFDKGYVVEAPLEQTTLF